MLDLAPIKDDHVITGINEGPQKKSNLLLHGADIKNQTFYKYVYILTHYTCSLDM